MTEIKFRIWNKNKEVYDYVSFNELYKFMQLLEVYLANYNHFPIIIEQYSGFHDKNFIDIYAGDIVLMDNIITEVKFINGSFDLFKPSKIENGSFIYTSPDRKIQDYYMLKIIGNIHDHKHLLCDKLEQRKL